MITAREGSADDEITCGGGNDAVYADRGDVVASDCENVGTDAEAT